MFKMWQNCYVRNFFLLIIIKKRANQVRFNSYLIAKFPSAFFEHGVLQSTQRVLLLNTVTACV